jgi:hypothetical protein
LIQIGDTTYRAEGLQNQGLNNLITLPNGTVINSTRSLYYQNENDFKKKLYR